MKRHLMFGCVLIFVTLAGCAVNRDLNFPADGELVMVTVKGHDDLAVRPIKIGYRSEICTLTSYTSDLKPYKKASYNVTVRDFIHQKGTGLYRVEVPVEGGGQCNWRLSFVDFGVEYTNLDRFGSGVKQDGGGGVIVLFDSYGGPRGGTHREVDGDLVISEDYYLWVSENFIGGYEKYGGLLRVGDIYVTYKASRAKKVHFEPAVHSAYVVFSKGPAIKAPGARTTYLYPDGSTIENSRGKPDFQKLQCIRLPSQCKK